MSRIAKEFFENSPVLAMPLISLGVFLMLFIGLTIFVLKMKKSAVDHAAKLPLEGETEVRHG